MGIQGSFTNITSLMSSLYPAFIIMFLVMASLFNYTPLKGITFLSGIAFCYVMWMLLARLFGKPSDPNASLTCNLLNIPGLNYQMPNRQSILTWFTLVYLLLPMLENVGSLFNPVILGVMLILTISNMAYQVFNKCSDWIGIILGSVLGILFGIIWFTIFWSAGKKDLLFYNELVSNNVVCNRPAKQTFRCSVYKNGEIISSSVV